MLTGGTRPAETDPSEPPAENPSAPDALAASTSLERGRAAIGKGLDSTKTPLKVYPESAFEPVDQRLIITARLLPWAPATAAFHRALRTFGRRFRAFVANRLNAPHSLPTIRSDSAAIGGMKRISVTL